MDDLEELRSEFNMLREERDELLGLVNEIGGMLDVSGRLKTGEYYKQIIRGIAALLEEKATLEDVRKALG